MRRLLVLLLLVSCGAPAEAKPRAREVLVRIATIDPVNVAEVPALWASVQERLRAAETRIPFNYVLDGAYADDRPDLLTLDNFWNGNLFNYWKRVFNSRLGMRLVLIAPLTNGMTGGWADSLRNIRSNFLLAQVNGDICRDAAVVVHELGHALGAPDRHTGQSIMNDAAFPAMHDDCAFGFDSIDIYQIRGFLRLKRKGHTICVGCR